jgi:serine protease AprX
VIVTFKDKVKVPRFPEPNMAEPRNSAGNKANEAAVQQVISTLERVRAPTYDARAKGLAAKHAAREKARFWLIDAMVLELPLSAVSDVAARDDVQYVEHVKTDAPPPQYYISTGRWDISSDPYSGFVEGWIGLLDTGIRASHTLLSERYDYLRDCTSGTDDCSGGNSDDGCHHGTAAASILSGNNNLGGDYRGVTNYITIDSWKVYAADCSPDTNAAVLGLENAVAAGDRFIAVNLQVRAADDSALSTAADAAFDAGSVVIAAAGNYGPNPSTVRAPANAHKVLAVGATGARSLLLQSYSGRGPAPDGRFKPDFTAPTNVSAASWDSDTAVRWFGGTGGAMPFGAAATALAYNFLRGFGMTIDPGQVYAYMILAGRNRYFNNDEGTGLLSMPPTDGSMSYGMVTVADDQSVDITMPCWPTESVEAAIWWPETTTTHNDIDLYLVQPDGWTVDYSQMVTSVFEKVKVKSTPAPSSGLWTFRVHGVSVTGTQNVYFASLYR